MSGFLKSCGPDDPVSKLLGNNTIYCMSVINSPDKANVALQVGLSVISKAPGYVSYR